MQAAAIPIDAYDPEGGVATYIDELFAQVLQQENGAKKTVEIIWRAFEQTKRVELAEWAVQYAFLWWRDTPLGAERIRVARAAQQMAQAILAAKPSSIVGETWHAAYLGFEALSRGILDSLQVVPNILEAAHGIHKKAPNYFYGMGAMMIARVYFKAPPFPVSRGDLKKSLQILDAVRHYSEGRFAPWYLFYAEALHINGYIKEAQNVMTNWEDGLKPTNKIELMNLGMTRIDMANLKTAIDSGKYDRYLWDAYLVPLTREQMASEYRYMRQTYVKP